MPKVEFKFQLGDKVKVLPLGNGIFGVDGIVIGQEVHVGDPESVNRELVYSYRVKIGKIDLSFDADELKMH